MLRRTKILATLGPSTDDREVLQGIIRAGVDIVRLNFSHGVADEHRARARQVRESAMAEGREIGILVDLQGPKIRIAKFKEGAVTLKEGAVFTLDAEHDPHGGDEQCVGIDYKALPSDVGPQDILLLDDGRLELEVTSVEGSKVHTLVLVGGKLSNHKGINRKGGGLSAKSLTDKDKLDVGVAAEIGADFVALSFPRSKEDIEEARKLLKKAQCKASLIAKIERTEALTNIEEIIRASDGIMVARGDLGVEIGDAELPGVQKMLISRARSLNRLVITATQMMESMIQNSIPTRAEVFDVANAVLDGSDAVMLSAETATGAHPKKVVERMSNICLGAEKERSTQVSTHRMSRQFLRTDETIAMSAMYAANHTDIKAIICFTESGATPLWMSRINTAIPIFGFTRHITSLRKMTLFRGVYPVYFDATLGDPVRLSESAVKELEARNIVNDGDFIIITRGDILGVHGGTNRMKIVRVGEVLS